MLLIACVSLQLTLVGLALRVILISILVTTMPTQEVVHSAGKSTATAMKVALLLRTSEQSICALNFHKSNDFTNQPQLVIVYVIDVCMCALHVLYSIARLPLVEGTIFCCRLCCYILWLDCLFCPFCSHKWVTSRKYATLGSTVEPKTIEAMWK